MLRRSVGRLSGDDASLSTPSIGEMMLCGREGHVERMGANKHQKSDMSDEFRGEPLMQELERFEHISLPLLGLAGSMEHVGVECVGMKRNKLIG